MVREPLQYRHEFKYIISEGMMAVLRNRVINLLQPDPHAKEGGIYLIRSIYFDDYANTCYYENENGTDPREKFRIRFYNHSDDKISLDPLTMLNNRKQFNDFYENIMSSLP